MVKILAIIPARSGSKKIKHKNIRYFKGKPLLAHSILHSIKSKFVQRTIVSTDSSNMQKLQLNMELRFLF